MTEQKKRLKETKRYTMADLVEITALLRAPDGCPWDREQTHQSVRKCVIEEAYEVAEAIDLESPTMLREELGDLLFQAVFHAQIATEQGAFTIEDVIDEVARKMVERHPHVFEAVVAENSEQALSAWDNAKRKEKHHADTYAAMDSVARTLPSLMRAQKLIHKSKNTPFGVCAPQICENEEELAQQLFALCAEADRLGVDAEQVLDAENESFLQKIERKLHSKA